jgi:dihydrofolate reductase
MQAPGGPEEDPTAGFIHGGWSFNYWDDVMGKAMSELMAAPFDLLLGRKTYEIFAAHWPYLEGDPVAEKLNRVTKYVATSSATPLTWRNSVAIRGDLAAEVTSLRQQAGANLLVQGSGDLLQTLLANGLIDEFRLWLFPLVLGSGKRLFGRGAIAGGWKLVETKTSRTGVTMNTYLRAGAVTAGSFALAEPTAAEVARRQKMKQES